MTVFRVLGSVTTYILVMSILRIGTHLGMLETILGRSYARRPMAALQTLLYTGQSYGSGFVTAVVARRLFGATDSDVVWVVLLPMALASAVIGYLRAIFGQEVGMSRSEGVSGAILGVLGTILGAWHGGPG